MRKGQKTNKPAWNANPIYKNCLVCEREFRTILAKIKVGKGKFCSKGCYLKNHKMKWEKVKCLGCNILFRAIVARKQKCCSLSCNARWKRIKGKDSKRVMVNCKQCGTQMMQLKTKINDGRGKFCSKKCYSKWLSINQIGEKSPAWRGGITPLYKGIRISGKYYKWRKEILLRDKECTICSSTEELEVDHIKPFVKIVKENNIKFVHESYLCEELWETRNGRVLCHTCHLKTTSYRQTV